jgi:cytochrome c oxidase assembly factor CtaG
LVLLYVAAASPLDALDETYVSAHMAQHLILMMLAPGLILLGHPVLPILRGLPRRFVRRVLRPVLAWRGLRKFFELLSSPPLALALYATSTIAWHVPYLYELAVESEAWHALEHGCFFWTGLLFWWPVIRPGFGKSRWPEWIGIPYLLLGDVLNTVLSAFFVFSGRVLYPSYAVVQNAARSALDDQILAGAIMWVPGSIVYILPAVVIAIRLLSPVRYTAHPLYAPDNFTQSRLR